MKLYQLYIEIGKLIESSPADAGLEVYVKHPDRIDGNYVKRVEDIMPMPTFSEVPEGGVLRHVSGDDGVLLG